MTASEQARTDAMADAATLRLEESRYPKDVRTLLGEASIFGNGARFRMVTRELWNQNARAAASLARSAAHAAFQAVPGLRGE